MSEAPPIPNKLFHYTKRELALEYILPTLLIRLGLLGQTNDPREVKEWGAIVTEPHDPSEDPLQMHERMTQVQLEMNRIRREEWKVLCMTRNHPNLKPQKPNTPEGGRRFLCGWSHSRLWAQYAENHSGVCLIFDGPKLDTAIRETLGDRVSIFCGSVGYQNELDIEAQREAKALYISYPENCEPDLTKGLREHMRRNWKIAFLRKSKDWATEWEYRWLVHGENPEPEYVKIQDALRGVLVGVDFPKVYEPSLIELCKPLNIPVGRMSWFNGVPHASQDCIYKPLN